VGTRGDFAARACGRRGRAGRRRSGRPRLLAPRRSLPLSPLTAPRRPRDSQARLDRRTRHGLGWGRERAVVVYLFILAAFRFTGKRQVGQLTPFDLVVLLLISNVAQNVVIGPDNALTGGAARPVGAPAIRKTTT
jgi:hypothetical protein